MHPAWPILGVLVVALAGCFGGTAPPSASSTSPLQPEGQSNPPGAGGTGSAGAGQQQGMPGQSPQQCHGVGTVPLTTLPMALADFSILEPYGIMVGGHVTPIDHMYFMPADWPGHRDEYDVHAIADGQVSNIQTRPSHQPAGSTADSVEYRIWIDHTCTFHSYVDLVTSLSPRLLQWYQARIATGPAHNGTDLPIKAGELLGKVGGQTLDFGVYNDRHNLTGLIVPAHYARESWKIHTDDPFAYFTEPTRSQLLSKDVRNAEPRAGRIDHDVDGRLVGNWFQVGTNGYAGANPNDPSNYWSGHLSLSPDTFIPSHLFASIGNWPGGASQFAIKGNGPDFAQVSEASGLVKYELVGWQYQDADHPEAGKFQSFPHPMPHPEAINDDKVVGVLLVQLTAPRLLKVEAFAGKTGSDVTGFDGSALMYER